MPLTDTTIRSAQPAAKPVRLFDEKGLYLEISPSGGKWWRFKYRFAGKENRLSLGTYPNVSLDEARHKRNEFRGLLADGLNPSELVKTERVAKHAEESRQLAATRFMLDSKGALLFRLGNRVLALSPAETSELRTFLQATRDVISKVTPCR